MKEERGQVDTITISAPVSVEFNRRLAVAVAERGFSSKAAAIRQVLEMWVDAAVCPQCQRPTAPHPDTEIEGVRFCYHCGESVGFSGNGGQALAE